MNRIRCVKNNSWCWIIFFYCRGIFTYSNGWLCLLVRGCMFCWWTRFVITNYLNHSSGVAAFPVDFKPFICKTFRFCPWTQTCAILIKWGGGKKIILTCCWGRQTETILLAQQSWGKWGALVSYSSDKHRTERETCQRFTWIFHDSRCSSVCIHGQSLLHCVWSLLDTSEIT